MIYNTNIVVSFYIFEICNYNQARSPKIQKKKTTQKAGCIAFKGLALFNSQNSLNTKPNDTIHARQKTGMSPLSADIKY